MAVNGTAYVIEWNLGGGDSLWLHRSESVLLHYTSSLGYNNPYN